MTQRCSACLRSFGVCGNETPPSLINTLAVRGRLLYNIRPMITAFRSSLALLSLLLLITSSAAAPPNPAALGMDAAKLKEIPTRMQKFVDDGVISGAVTLVARREGVACLDAVGFSDLAAKRPMRADDLFWIASMTKPLTATCVLMLQDEGKLSVEDPVEKHLPEFKGQWMVATRGKGFAGAQAPGATDHIARPAHPHLRHRQRGLAASELLARRTGDGLCPATIAVRTGQQVGIFHRRHQRARPCRRGCIGPAIRGISGHTPCSSRLA